MKLADAAIRQRATATEGVIVLDPSDQFACIVYSKPPPAARATNVVTLAMLVENAARAHGVVRADLMCADLATTAARQ
jgi:hypothetical protein